MRWVGILLIALGVGFVARGPSVTVEHSHAKLPISNTSRGEV